ncbi:RPA-related protein RADX isoform X2 [Hyperolius riggenbachi]|uniref:RPA-related protein RADX isoform X2 n=1 Tax=Hyperolius riggenbachi TaxID=752182 RepID=UPI0035A39877
MQQEQLAELDAGGPAPSPGSPAGELAASWLQRARHEVQQSPSMRVPLRQPQSVCVLAVQRYQGESSRCRYHYDITLYDGTVQDTWLLSPELRHLLHTNLLYCGSRVSITLCSYRYLEKRLATGLVCIEELEISGEEACAIPPGVHLPLCGGRSHYLPLWNNDDPYGDMWEVWKPAQALSVDVSKVCSLQMLEQRWGLKTPLPPLLVRIMHKSRLRYFGRVDKKIDYPYQAYFEVADHSGMRSVVMWNALCPEWYNTLQVGNVVFLQQYVVKKSYAKRTFPTPGNLQVKRLPNLEISLNARDPTSKITVLQEKDVKPEWKLPAVKYQFISRSELNNLPHNKVCDVIGLVTHVGRCERRRIGVTYLVCTQMRVILEHPENQPYLTTSNESQVFISGHHKAQPYLTDEKVKHFIAWMKSQRESEFKRKVSIGGYHPYPHTADTFAKFCGDNKDENVLTPISELMTVINQLHYRERRRVAVQGIIAACRLVGDGTEKVSQVESHEKVASIQDSRDGNAECPLTDEQMIEHKDVSTSSKNKLVPHSEMSNVAMAKRRKQCDKEEHNVISSENSATAHHSCHNVDTAIPEDKEKLRSLVESEQSHGSLPTERSWENDLWSKVKHHITDHLNYSTVFPESLIRLFDYNQKEFLMQQYNLQPAKLVKTMYTSKLEDFPSVNVLGHYEVTILGINHNIAIDVSRPVYRNISLFTSNCLPDLTQCPIPSCDTKYKDHCWLSVKDELVKYASAQDNLHTVCILDICHLGERKVEISLNRVYCPVSGQASTTA